MSDTIDDIRKPRGRPKTNSTAVMVRIPPDQLARIDRFMKMSRIPARPEAVRILVGQALDAALGVDLTDALVLGKRVTIIGGGGSGGGFDAG